MELGGTSLNRIHNYFENRKIKVQSDGAISNEILLTAGTPQGAVLSPLLFNIMLSDIPINEDVDIYVYADDISVSCIDSDVDRAKQKMQIYLRQFSLWAETWGLIINPQKTFVQHFTRKRNISCPLLRIQNKVIEYKKSQKLLGVILDSPRLTYKPHIDYLRQDCIRRIDLMKTISSAAWGASSTKLRQFYVSYIRSKIDYGSVLYGSSAPSNLKKLDCIQNACLRLILGCRKTTPITSLEVEASIPSLCLHREYLDVKLLLKLNYKQRGNNTADFLGLNEINPPNSTYSFGSFLSRASNLLAMYDFAAVRRIYTASYSMLPWSMVSKYIQLDLDRTIFNDCSFNDYINCQYQSHSVLYTDGSKKEDNGNSVAAALYSPQHNSITCWKLRPDHSVVSAELYANMESLEIH